MQEVVPTGVCEARDSHCLQNTHKSLLCSRGPDLLLVKLQELIFLKNQTFQASIFRENAHVKREEFTDGISVDIPGLLQGNIISTKTS